MARAFALFAPFQPVFYRVLEGNKTVPNAPKEYKMHQTWVQVPMGWIESVRCEKFRHDFVARSFALISPVWRILQQVSCSREMVPNAPKRKGTHENMSLRSNGVDRECSLRKIQTRHRCTNFCINCTKFCAVAKLFQNAPERKETHQNMSLGSNGVDRERSLQKF